MIDAASGQISVAGDAVLGIEQNGELYELEVRLKIEFCKVINPYCCQVRVTDQGSPHSQTASTVVRVRVEDVNNQPPVLAQPSYTAYVLENEPRGHTVLTASASDPDRNAELEFDIVEPIIARDKVIITNFSS